MFLFMLGLVRVEVGASSRVACTTLGQCIRLACLLIVSFSLFLPLILCVSMVCEVH
jgi:hypothetical protein